MASSVSPAAAADPAGGRRARARRYFSAARFIVLLAVAGVAVTLVCAAFGYGLARQGDERHAEEQRAALRAGVSEFRALFAKGDEVDPRFVRMVEQSAGLRDVKFESEPAAAPRETQPVLNANGRIVGFLTWQPDAPMTAAMNRLMPVVAAIAFVLVAFAGFALLQLRRARNDLARSEQEARIAAETDALTGLPNHARMLALLDQALAARSGEQIVSFGLIELAGIDGIVAQYGATGGDDIVAVVATHLKEALPQGAVCGRGATGGFAVILTGPHHIETVMRSAIGAASRPHWIDTVVRVSAYASFAQAPRDATTRDELARRAELALRSAAQKGAGSLVAFERAIDTAASDQQFIRRELPRALSAQALELAYQPIVSADGVRILGAEALLRWTHSERGVIPPATFIPVAEQMGLMDALGAFVLRRALSEARRWPELYISVNLSPLQVRDRGIVDLVRDVLAETGVAPSRLILEVTEGVLIDNPDEMVRRIADLRALGVRIALDDFGSGYSNLGYLQRFSFDKLKIDKSFVDALGRSANAGVIIQAIIALGRALGMAVVVEGVETEQQRVLLRLAGCDEMQGFLFARPAPAKALESLLANANKAASRAGKSAA